MLADTLKAIAGQRLVDTDGDVMYLELLPPATEQQIRALEAKLPGALPDEIRSALAFARQPIDAPAWKALSRLEQEHRALLAEIKTRYQDFSNLDERFHRLINDASKNRFIEDFHDVISLIFHYHYQWNKADERERNAVAIAEHLDYIKALQTRDPQRIEAACRKHLASARETLLRSIA